MATIQHLFDRNIKWAEENTKNNPDFFKKLADQQSPEYLWIGCSDSRVPANTLMGLLPGEVFVHRNIANQVIHSDLNCLSVLQYAVEVLKVKHVIVCGHYGCGGINAALDDKSHGLIDNWLRHIEDVHRFHKEKLDNIKDPKEKSNLLSELNVIEQVHNVSKTTIIKNAWANKQDISIHGFIYNIHDGILHDLNVSLGLD